jgi:hypothetical protein
VNTRHAATLLAAAALACTAPDSTPAPCAGEKCDSLEGDDQALKTPCSAKLVDRSGRGFLPARLAQDPLIEHVYMKAGDGCPVTAAEIFEVLGKNDRTRCSINTHVISEQAQLLGTSEGASYRVITSRACGGRPAFGLLFSMFGFAGTPEAEEAGLHPGGASFPDGIEVIAFDEENQVFNYYKEVDGKMGFFGSSTDYVTQGPGGPDLTSVRGCANCHTGGGLIMKELENPWLHWEEIPSVGLTTFERRSPGAQELVDSRPPLGKAADGPHLEQRIIKPGNQAWNARRVAFMKDEGSVADLLRPLFCPVEVQVAATFNKRRVNHNFLVDQSLLRALGLRDDGRIDTRQADYDNVLAAAGSNVPGTDQADVNLAMAHVTRAHADMDHVEKLIAAGVIDREFANDVLMVDFTRQVFSDDRCDLLDLAPDLEPAQRSADRIRAGFLESLADAEAGTPAAQLRAHLEEARSDHRGAVSAFLEACAGRGDDAFSGAPARLAGASELVIDALRLRSLGRKLAMEDGALDRADGSAEHLFKVFEFEDTLPLDEIAVSASAAAGNPLQIHPKARLSPADCELVTRFVAAADEEPAPAGACPGRCGEFVQGASCQCDARCSEFGNCCEGWEPVRAACPGAPFEFVQGAACQCDDRCAEFGNCCEGWQPMCLAD